MGDMLSQAEIEALLGGEENNQNEVALSDDEKDILGEVGNISMGTSATTLFSLLKHKVQITTPTVRIETWKEIADGYDRPCVGIQVDYIEGLQGSNVLVLKDMDVKTISNLMLGGDGTDGINEPLNDIDISAIQEAMNQMIGSASTSLSNLVNMKIDINTPHAFQMDFSDDSFFNNLGFQDEKVVTVSFRMVIENLIDSRIMQILPFDFAKKLVEIMLGDTTATVSAPVQTAPPPASAPVAQAQPPQQKPQPGAPAQPAPQPGPQYAAPVQQPVYQAPQQQYVNVAPAQFQSFDLGDLAQQKENIGILKDVPLEITAELGRTTKTIREILEYAPGSIIDLERIAGEPIDILVNGKYVAKGEVVVNDENFAIRVTDIISAEHRI